MQSFLGLNHLWPLTDIATFIDGTHFTVFMAFNLLLSVTTY